MAQLKSYCTYPSNTISIVARRLQSSCGGSPGIDPRPDQATFLGDHDDVIKWKHCSVTGPLCGEFTGHQSIPLTKATWRGALMFPFHAWTNGWANNRDAGDFRRHRSYYDVTVIYGSVCSVYQATIVVLESFTDTQTVPATLCWGRNMSARFTYSVTVCFCGASSTQCPRKVFSDHQTILWYVCWFAANHQTFKKRYIRLFNWIIQEKVLRQSYNMSDDH